MLLDFSYEKVIRETERLGYKALQSINDLMIVGWRNKNARLNRFDCFISTYRNSSFGVVEQHFPATTYPGLPYLLNPLMPKGTATVVPGQYVASHALGRYKGYIALKQIAPLKVYRDANKDSVRDLENVESGLFGIHIHRAGILSAYVGTWSAGCQVFQKRDDFDTFIDICQRYAEALGNKFNYTLLEF